MKNLRRTRQSGHSLIEVLVVIVILGLFAIPFLMILARLNQHFTKLSLVSQGMFYSQRNLEITTNLVQNNWNIVKNLDKNKLYYLQQTAGGWTFLEGAENLGPYTTSITFASVCRDDDKNIVECDDPNADIEDTNAVRATSKTEWKYRNQPQDATLHTIFSYIF